MMNLEPIRPETYSFRDIPGSASRNAIVSIHQIPTGELTAPAGILADVHGSQEDLTVPVHTYLIEKDGHALLWDLGLMENLENATPWIRDVMLKKLFKATPGPGPIKRLQEGGYDTSQITEVILSHQHFDHFGDLDTLSEDVKVILGPGSLASIGSGYPDNTNGPWPKKWLEEKRLIELPSPDQGGSWPKDFDSVRAIGPTAARKWQQVACFEHAVDWFGDGSLWLALNEGVGRQAGAPSQRFQPDRYYALCSMLQHCSGHLNALARVTTNPDTYVLLAGDTAHHQSLILPVPSPRGQDRRTRIPFFEMPESGGKQVSMHEDPAQALLAMGRLTRLSAEDNVMVLLAHEGQVKGVIPDWPEPLNDWKARGYKEKKEDTVE